MQMTFIAENIAIVLNILLICVFHYEVSKKRKEILLKNNNNNNNNQSNSNLKKIRKKLSISSFSSFHKRSHSRSSSSFRKENNKNELHDATVNLTYLLLIIGLIFSLCQGLIENWLTIHCDAAWLQWLTFFFFSLHRSLLLYSFLHRLMFVFRNSSYKYPNWFYFVFKILIVIYWISSYIIYGIDHSVKKVDIDMYTGYSGNLLCSWSFGILFSGIARPCEIVLTLILVTAFLYKLWQLNKATANVVNSNHGINRLLVVFRKITLLTISAIATTIVITFGYINYKPFAFALSLDNVFNSFCVFLMFQFNQKYIKPCFGKNCNHCFCIKCNGICKCRLMCKCVDDTNNSFEISKTIVMNTRSFESDDVNTSKTPASITIITSNGSTIQADDDNINNDIKLTDIELSNNNKDQQPLQYDDKEDSDHDIP